MSGLLLTPTSATPLAELLAWLGIPRDSIVFENGRLDEIRPGLLRIELRGPHARRTWRHLRRYMLTSTDWSAVLGLNPNKNAWSVWQEKVQGPTPEEQAAEEAQEAPFTSPLAKAGGLTEAMRWGNVLEDPVARETAARIGRRIVDHGRYTLFLRTDLPFPAGASIDREIEASAWIACGNNWHPEYGSTGRILLPFCPDCREKDQPGKVAIEDPRGRGLMEIKTVGAFADPEGEWSEDGRGPVRHQIQLQAGLCVTGWSWGVLSGLNGAPAFNLKHYEHQRDDALIAWALDRLAVFWQYVKTKTPPPVDGSESTAKALARFYDRDNGNEEGIELPPIAAAYARELAEAKDQQKRGKDRERAARNEITALMGESLVGVIPAMDGGLRLKRIETKPSCCPSCKAVVSQKKPYRRLTAFGDAKFEELFAPAEAEGGGEDA